MKQKIITMLHMQDEMNSRVNQNWRGQGFEWYRAIWVESAELLDHYGWKWWKKQQIDREQVVLELVDIWHFGLSILLSGELPEDDLIKKIEDELTLQSAKSDFRLALEEFAGKTLINRQFNLPEFGSLMFLMGIGFDQLYQNYVGKNVLNFFRQDHGYKEGRYIKVWHGKEDNEHLASIISELDEDREDFRDAVYRGLQARYESCLQVV